MFQLLGKFLIYIILSLFLGLVWNGISYIVIHYICIISKNKDVHNDLEKNFVLYWITNSIIIFGWLIYIFHNFTMK